MNRNDSSETLETARVKTETDARALSGLWAAAPQEIRARVNTIIDLSQLQLRKDCLPAEYKAAFSEISGAAGSLLKTINDILGPREIRTDGVPVPAGYDAADPAADEAEPANDIMPYGKVLIVDDMEANLYMAELMMQPYMVSIDMAESGFEAVELVNNGKVYDIIFMDHMMPEMDGIETARKLRGLGYAGAVVALTANTAADGEEMFYENGFDGFLPKPIDAGCLDGYMNKFIRDRHPEEAKKAGMDAALAKAGGSRPAYAAAAKKSGGGSARFCGVVPEMLEVFRRDAAKTVTELRETIENNNMKRYTTTVHAIKSALAYVGEEEASQSALMLEKAGMDGNMEYINSNTGFFIKTLEELIKAIPEPAAKTTEEDDSKITEDKMLLTGQLRIAQFACEDYDAEMAYEALDVLMLKEKQWKKKTANTIKWIREMIYLHSDFEKAAEVCEKMAG